MCNQKIMGNEHSKREKNGYLTLNNGGEPYRVIVPSRDEGAVVIIDNESEDQTEILRVVPEKVFIGKSPRNHMTRYSGGYGSEFDGNSILIHVSDLDYIYVGDKIFRFTAETRIVRYVSPVGNNLVPYPYAVDENDSFYLMIENVVTQCPGLNENLGEDPYSDCYYSNNYMLNKYDNVIRFDNIEQVYIGGTPSNLPYTPNPSEKFKRLTRPRRGEGKDKIQEIVVVRNGERETLNERSYIDLIHRYGEDRGLRPLSNKVLIHEHKF